jgi:FkbM family methyltransferase
MIKEKIRFSSRKIELKQFLRYLFYGSYSQYGEDLIMYNIFDKKDPGFYVDVGASQPKKFNNTYMFYLKGWKGINIDPNPDSKKQFDNIRPRDINYTYGVANKITTMPFYVISDPMYSTFLKEEVNDSMLGGKKIEKIVNVKVRKLKDILAEQNPKKIDFMSIDTEGYDLEVLKSNDWKKYKPSILCVEGHKDADKINDFLKEKGYIRVFKETNSIFILMERIVLKLRW